MNKEQATFLRNMIKEYDKNVSKKQEIHSKFFKDPDYIFNADPEPIPNLEVQIGVFGFHKTYRNSGNTITIPQKFIPVVAALLEQIMNHYEEINNGIDIDGVVETLYDLDAGKSRK